ncbi:MAG: serine hydrolase domain-containing protein, partial [Shewanella sp.]
GLVEYSHTGYLTGYMAMTLHYPELNLDLVMLENLALNLNDRDRVFALHNQIRQLIRSQLALPHADKGGTAR